MISENVNLIGYRIKDFYSKRFGTEPKIAIQSPGRINIMGEHTDYNNGFVLPAAIDRSMFIALSKNGTNDCNCYSVDYKEEGIIDLQNVKRSEIGWLNLISGVVDQLKDRIGGFDLAFGGNIPEGSGLSSSAALCCGVAMGLSELFDLKLDKWKMARIAQYSEHHFAGVQCGIMDQFACLFGLTNHALLLNCLTLEDEPSAFDLVGYKFVLFNSNVPHDLKTSAYNNRRRESKKALDMINSVTGSAKTYQDVTPKDFMSLKGKVEPHVWKRAMHVVTENDRVFKIKEALSKRRFEEVGKLLTASHMSAKHDYEITCEQTDFLVEQFTSHEDVYGGRQVGGGFGGCILAIAKDKNIEEMLSDLDKKYQKKYHLSISHIPIHISRGCHLLED